MEGKISKQKVDIVHYLCLSLLQEKTLGLTSKATIFFFFSTDYFQSVHSSSSKDNFEVKNCQFSMSSGLLSGKHNSR